MEAKVYSLRFPDWKPVDFKYWPADNGFVMKTRRQGTNDDTGTVMGFYSYSFVDTDDNGEVTRWETHVNSEYSDFLDVAIDGYTGLSRKILDHSALMKRMVDEAKEPGFTIDSWGPLAKLIDTENFERVGNFKEVMKWQDYIGFLTGWASSSEWDCSFKRVTHVGNVVFLELEERSQIGEFSNAVNSASVYEFNDAGKITHIDVYLQMALPDPEMLASYSDVEI